MILVGGLTPAWQQIVLLDSFRRGEVNRARSVEWCASGKVLNVTTALLNLGAPVTTVCPAGGTIGSLMIEQWKSKQDSFSWIPTALPTRVCTTILAEGGEATELVENAHPISEDELHAFTQSFREKAKSASTMVLAGSLAHGVTADFYRQLIEGFTGKVIIDGRGKELLSALVHRPTLVKPNREELEITFGVKLNSEAEIIRQAHILNELGAKWVVVTQGPGPVLAVSAQEAYRALPIPVQVKNPIGSGDSMSAGIAEAIDRGISMPTALKFGMSAAALNCEELLPAKLDATRYPDRASRVVIEKLSAD